MRTFRKVLWALVVAQLLFTLVCYLVIAPQPVGLFSLDALGSHYRLFLEPFAVFSCGLGVSWLARCYRHRKEIKATFPGLVPFETYLLLGMLVYCLFMSFLILDHSGIMKMLQG